MEILFADDMMIEICNRATLDCLADLFLAFYWLDCRWIREIEDKYTQKKDSLKTIFRQVIDSVESLCKNPHQLYSRYEAYLLYAMLLGNYDPTYLSIDLDKLQDPADDTLYHLIQKRKDGDFNRREGLLYCRIFDKFISDAYERK